MSTLHEHRFPDTKALTHALAGELQVDLQEAIAARGVASMAVSGGRTPAALFQQLSNEQLDWHKVWVTLVDDRWVDATHDASNEKLVKENLIKNKAANARFVGLKNAAENAQAGIDWCWKTLTRISRPFDAVLLGMGDDGHTASLFPNNDTLRKALSPTEPPAVVAMTAPVEPRDRISLNLSAILDSRRIIVLIQGDTKWSVYQRARTAGDVTDLPIRAVFQQHLVPVDVFWSP
jgi:6-phosphogluconolactonase